MFLLSQPYALKLHNVASFTFVSDSTFLHNSLTSLKIDAIFLRRINGIWKNVKLVQIILLK